MRSRTRTPPRGGLPARSPPLSDYLRLARYLRPYRGRFLLALVFLSLVGVTMAGLTSLLIPISDLVLGGGGAAGTQGTDKLDVLRLVERWIDLEALQARLGLDSDASRVHSLVPVLMLLLFLVKGVAMYFGAYWVLSVGHRVVMDLRRDLYESLQRQSIVFFSHHPTGTLISRVTNDVERIKATISRHLGDTCRLLATLVVITIYAFYLHWKLATLCLVVIPAVALPVLKFGRRLKKTSRKSQERMADVTNILHETITGVRIVKGFGMEAFEISRFRDALGRMLRFDLKAARTLALAPPVMELIGAIAGAILLWHAGRAIAAGTLDSGVFVAVIASLGLIYTHIKRLSKIYNEASQAMAATRRAFEVLDAEIDVVEAPAAATLAPFRKEIRFENVAFAYDDQPVLREINLTVPAGQVTALVGTSGAGKSTLVNLLPRFYDATGGSVRIDGVDVRDVTFASLRSQIGLVTQEIILFNDSARANIAYGMPNPDQERVEAAARAALAHEFIEAMPDGYDSMLGERAQRLSVGQRQRISIARALYKDAPILILDEATSHLDALNERAVRDALDRLTSDRTT